MSEERLAECSLLEGDRFAAVAFVIDRVTHDINNLLLPIVAYPPLVRREISEGSHACGMIDAIEQAGQSMLHITNQLMAIQPDRDGNRSRIDLNEVAEWVVKTVLGEGIAAASTLTLRGNAAAITVEGSLNRTRQVIDVLVRNALEALSAQGGTVQVAVREISLEAGRFGDLPVRPGVFGAVCVTDDGEGFTEEVGKRLFDPFYTTRRCRSRRGAGLGLSIAYRAAADQNGWLTYRSDPGKGAAFTLYLPRA